MHKFIFSLIFIVVFGFPSSVQLIQLKYLEEHYPVIQDYTFYYHLEPFDCGRGYEVIGCINRKEKMISVVWDEPTTDWNLAHEIVHAYGFTHSPQMSEFTMSIYNQIPFRD